MKWKKKSIATLQSIKCQYQLVHLFFELWKHVFICNYKLTFNILSNRNPRNHFKNQRNTIYHSQIPSFSTVLLWSKFSSFSHQLTKKYIPTNIHTHNYTCRSFSNILSAYLMRLNCDDCEPFQIYLHADLAGWIVIKLEGREWWCSLKWHM